MIVHSQLLGCIKQQSNLMNRMSLFDIGLNTRLHDMLPCIALHTGMTQTPDEVVCLQGAAPAPHFWAAA